MISRPGFRRFFRLDRGGDADVARAVDDELTFHFDMTVRDLVAGGLDREAAEQEAVRRFGDVQRTRQRLEMIDRHHVGRIQRGEWWDTIAQDLRFALRSLRRSPGFTAAAVLALGLGMGSAAAIFTLLECVVLRPLPYSHPERLVMVWETNAEKNLTHEGLSPVNFLDYRALHAVFQDAAAWWHPEVTLGDDETGEPIRVAAIETTSNLFGVLGIRPLVGHDFASDSALRPGEHEVIIGQRLWQTRFAGNPRVIGRDVRLNGNLYTIVGVMPPGFGFPGQTELWQRLDWELSQHSRGAHFMESVFRLTPNASLDRANRELHALGGRMAAEHVATNAGWSVRAAQLDREIAGVFRPALFALLASSALLLLIACINVANLLLARATVRRREVAVRAALGANRSRLVQLFVTESVLLAGLGALVGLGVATLCVKGLLAWAPVQIPRANEVGLHLPVLLVALLVALMAALAFGLAPALLVSRGELYAALRDGARGASAQGGRVRGALVVAEIALAVVMLSGAGLLIRSVAHLLHADAGVNATAVIAADVQLPDGAYPQWDRVDRYFQTLLVALRARPEVAAAGATSFLPLTPAYRVPITVVGAAPVPKGDEPQVQVHTVDDGYFNTLRVPIFRGRGFDERDLATAPGVAIVNQALARQLWPGRDPIGQRFTTETRQIGPLGLRLVKGNEHEVIGVVGDIKNNSLRNAPEPAAYFSEHQFPFRKLHVVVRGRGDGAQLGALVRNEVRRLDPSLPVPEIRTMDRVLSESVDPPRFIMWLMTVFAGLALTLSAVGIYGILSYVVAQRRREIGIRVALGAQPWAMLRMIVGKGLAMAALGCAFGAAGAWFAGRSLASFLYEVSPSDPVTLGGVLALVIVVTIAACFVPGRRASAADPSQALRAD